ncbi:HNH endonuclease signature motif containing protein [Galactobacter caseinivorans]|uniref:HNH endonuclease n=1 Tax=Galactobacter caseinivorans TaxID=2676123 RepID=A0A496PFN9_9MICC|nr:HNH endonuclease signature motif containing protein [Galactobacter caseinivorans]RKW69557.1 HNH endonuclease [Galactobacter caseinivorans]
MDQSHEGSEPEPESRPEPGSGAAAGALAGVVGVLRGTVLPDSLRWVEEASDAEVVAVLGQLAQLSVVMDALRVRAAAAVVARSEGLNGGAGRAGPDSLAHRVGARGSKALLMQLFGVPAPTAQGWICVAGAITPRNGFSAGVLAPLRPGIARGLEAGEVSAEQALTIHRELPQEVPETSENPDVVAGMLGFAEAALVAQASGGRVLPGEGEPGFGCEADVEFAVDAWGGRRLESAALSQVARAWANAIDPDGVEPDYEKQVKARSFKLSMARGGGWRMTGFAPELEGAAIRAVLDAYTSPRRKDPAPDLTTDPDSSSDPVSSDAGDVEAGEDSRTMDQRAFDALASLFASHASSGNAPTNHGAAPTLLVTATLPALHAFLNSAPAQQPVASPRRVLTAAPVATTDRGAGQRAGTDGPTVGVDVFADLRSAGQGWGRSPEPPPEPRHPFAGMRAPFGAAPPESPPPPAPAAVTLQPPPPLAPRRAQGPMAGNDPQALVDERFARVARSDAAVPVSQVMSMLCSADVQFMLTDEAGLPLKLGRARRHFSVHQRRALMVRDRHCKAPGCGAPPGWCEAHHVIPWNEGGPTDVDHAVLLCNFHHHEVHLGRLVVESTTEPAAVRPANTGAPAAGAAPGGAARRPWTVVSSWTTRQRQRERQLQRETRR